MQRQFHLFICLIFIVFSAACERADDAQQVQSEQPLPACHLTMGWDPWEPYQYATVEGEVSGLDVDVVKAIATHAGCTLDFARNDWASLLNGIRSGAIDVLAGATATPAREEYAYFSPSYRAEIFVLCQRAADVEAGRMQANSLAALLDEGFMLGVTDEYFYGSAIQALQSDPAHRGQFQSVEVGELNYAELLNGAIDGLLDDSFVTAAVVRRNGWEHQIVCRDIAEGVRGEVGLMVSRASVDQELMQRLNSSLQRLQADGSMQKILDKYSGE